MCWVKMKTSGSAVAPQVFIILYFIVLHVIAACESKDLVTKMCLIAATEHCLC